ncbi:complement C1q tumor necrosis factor-related protein 3-like [Mytilus californianus]|uniref:complement C1q tumor necrosis factor-related protein 3-like n=1 Tax=Mytilus californianus TaxID=6549 RepID=UPI002245BF7F|nr:complement C1q tumor necrosis factor-related protein 3-like [Mytilus californianus]
MNLSTVSVLTVILFGLMSKIQGSCDSKLENNLFKDLLNMMLKLKGSGSCHSGNGGKGVPAFSASLSSTKSYTTNNNVKFDKVWANIGNGYDADSGIFTASQSGVYQFSCTIMRHANYIRVHLWKNEVKTVAIWPGSTKDYAPGTLNLVMQLKKGDKVFIRNAQNQQIYSESGSHFSMFSGFMISN